MKKTPTVLCILDGFGINPDTEGNAVKQALTPNFNTLWKNFPHQTLYTHGERVGLPAGQMGNSEVGHLNIGAGRVVEQWLARISRLLRNGSLPTLDPYKQFLSHNKDRTLHLISIVSDGGVHGHINHLFMLLNQVTKDFTGRIIIHGITDGRDTGAHTGAGYVRKLEEKIAQFSNVSIGSLIGRFFSMDRDTRWDRIEKSYKGMVDGIAGMVTTTYAEAVEASYAKGLTDEFIEPVMKDKKDCIRPNDAVLFCNFREDRIREIVRVLTQPEFTEFPRQFILPSTQVLCLTEYDRNFNLPVLFTVQSLEDHLGETVSKSNLRQIRIAESDKYPHVTYFMNCKVEVPYAGEDRELIPSPRDVKTYDLKPEMSADKVCDAAIRAVQSDYDFIVVNFANCDMVGHTGNLSATITAVETVDTCLGKLVEAVKARAGTILVIADHGNAEQMIHYEDNSPHTAHTTYVVPIILAQFDGSKTLGLNDDGALCDVAPTILELMKIPQPTAMTGRSLLSK